MPEHLAEERRRQRRSGRLPNQFLGLGRLPGELGVGGLGLAHELGEARRAAARVLALVRREQLFDHRVARGVGCAVLGRAVAE